MTLRLPLFPICALFAIFFIVGSASPRAQPLFEGQAEIEAQSLTPIPVGKHVVVRLADDSDFNLRLADVVKEALRQSGFAVVEKDGAVTLRMETQNLTASIESDNSIGSLEAGSSVGVDLNIRLWSSTKNSLLKRNAANRERIPAFAIILDAYDEVARKPAWHAQAVTTDAEGTDFDAGNAMVRHLMATFGSSMKRTKVPLR